MVFSPFGTFVFRHEGPTKSGMWSRMIKICRSWSLVLELCMLSINYTFLDMIMCCNDGMVTLLFDFSGARVHVILDVIALDPA